MQTKRFSFERKRTVHKNKKSIGRTRVMKANQGENPVNEPFFPKNRTSDIKFFLYPDLRSQGLREKLATYTGYTPDYIYCSNGSDEALMLLIRLCVAPGEKILICPPTFFKYDFYATFARTEAITINRNSDFSLNIPKILAAITKKTKMIIIDSPGNPCGATITRKELKILLAREITVVIDECYFEYCQETVADLIRTYPNLIITRSFSKWTGLAGLRIGYVIAQENVIKGLFDIRFPCYINSVGQYFASYALDHQQEFLKRLHTIVRFRDMAIQRLKKYSGLTIYPSKGPFVVVKLNSLGSAQELQKFLERDRIYIYVINQPLNQPLLENSIRVNFSYKDEINYFCASMERWISIQRQHLV